MDLLDAITKSQDATAHLAVRQTQLFELQAENAVRYMGADKIREEVDEVREARRRPTRVSRRFARASIDRSIAIRMDDALRCDPSPLRRSGSSTRARRRRWRGT